MAAFAFTLGSPEHPGQHACICLQKLFPLRPATYFSFGQAVFSTVRWHRTGYGWPLWGFLLFFLFSPHLLWNQGNYIHIKRKKEIKSVKEKPQVKEPSLWASVWAREPSRIQILCPHSMILTAVREGFSALQGNPWLWAEVVVILFLGVLECEWRYQQLIDQQLFSSSPQTSCVSFLLLKIG